MKILKGELKREKGERERERKREREGGREREWEREGEREREREREKEKEKEILPEIWFDWNKGHSNFIGRLRAQAIFSALYREKKTVY